MKRLFPFAFILACFVLLEDAHSDAVIIKSDAAELTVGTVIPDGQSIEVPAGATLTLIVKSGATQTISGHFSGPVDAGGADSGAAGPIAQLLRSRGQGVSRLGAVRNSTVIDPSRPVVNLLLGEAACLEPGKTPYMAIPPRGQPQNLQLAGTKSLDIEWPASTSQIEWPRELPLIDRAAYSVTLDGLLLGEFEIRLLDDANSPLGVRIRHRIEANCPSAALKLIAESG